MALIDNILTDLSKVKSITLRNSSIMAGISFLEAEVDYMSNTLSVSSDWNIFQESNSVSVNNISKKAILKTNSFLKLNKVLPVVKVSEGDDEVILREDLINLYKAEKLSSAKDMVESMFGLINYDATVVCDNDFIEYLGSFAKDPTMVNMPALKSIFFNSPTFSFSQMFNFLYQNLGVFLIETAPNEFALKSIYFIDEQLNNDNPFMDNNKDNVKEIKNVVSMSQDFIYSKIPSHYSITKGQDGGLSLTSSAFNGKFEYYNYHDDVNKHLQLITRTSSNFSNVPTNMATGTDWSVSIGSPLINYMFITSILSDSAKTDDGSNEDPTTYPGKEIIDVWDSTSALKIGPYQGAIGVQKKNEQLVKADESGLNFVSELIRALYVVKQMLIAIEVFPTSITSIGDSDISIFDLVTIASEQEIEESPFEMYESISSDNTGVKIQKWNSENFDYEEDSSVTISTNNKFLVVGKVTNYSLGIKTTTYQVVDFEGDRSFSLSEIVYKKNKRISVPNLLDMVDMDEMNALDDIIYERLNNKEVSDS